MNYRHAFHAGNFADVFKHTILIGLLESLKLKSTPLCYIDTHSGAGRYDLGGDEARKTGEYLDGVMRVGAQTASSPMLDRYLQLLHAMNDGGALRFYPGSPLIASELLRDNDRAVLCELQYEESEKLRDVFAGDKRIHVQVRDGYGALAALLPPKERRGLVLIDPPFEAQDAEFRTIETALLAALQRWATGIYAIWYPIKLRQSVLPFQRWFADQGIRKVLAAELLIHSENSPLRLNGCGMILINPPWKFDEQLNVLFSALAPLLAKDSAPNWRVDWLTGE